MERRQVQRRKIILKIKLHLADEEAADFDWIKDLSAGGLFVMTETFYPIGEVLDFTLFLEGGVNLVKGRAKVIHQSLGPIQGMGLQFVDLSDEDREKIKKLVESIEVDEGK